MLGIVTGSSVAHLCEEYKTRSGGVGLEALCGVTRQRNGYSVRVKSAPNSKLPVCKRCQAVADKRGSNQ